MPIIVTPEMVDAAQQQLPGVWNKTRVRRALDAAFALVPGDEVKVATAVSVHFTLDEQQMRADVLAAVESAHDLLPLDQTGRLDLATLRTLVDAQPTTTATEPALNPTHEQPVFGAPADIARLLNVGRSTVSGWIKNREQNGMPGPGDGLNYDLGAVLAWHREWKGRDA